ncbi:hypothetical protein EDB48_104152 [Vibrio crassostreae]|nr:hypothetical protein EDB48_104152 [Vibrio crassostreae]
MKNLITLAVTAVLLANGVRQEFLGIFSAIRYG